MTKVNETGHWQNPGGLSTNFLFVMKNLTLQLFLLMFISGVQLKAQSQADTYQWPADSLVSKHLKQWQGYKFGILVHFGLYSKLGVVESWGLCPEDWVSRDGYDNYFQYATDYRNTHKVFNPVGFNPEAWANAFKSAGAKYLIFTTKHHDGFCLYDSKFSQFKVTDPSCPFSSNPRANIAKEVFAACRKEGMEVGAYFSLDVLS